jgi:hypothetical protein
MSLNLNGTNIEQIELHSDQVKDWLAAMPMPIHEVQDKLEVAVDEAIQQIAEEASNIEYVVIKILR